MRTLNQLSFGMLILTGLTACESSETPSLPLPGSAENPPISVQPDPTRMSEGAQCFVEDYKQGSAVRTSKVDIMFVIDSSASLYNNLDRIADNLDRFLVSLPKDTDARFAVVLGHSQDSKHYGKLYARSETGSNLCKVYDSGTKARQACDALPTAEKRDLPVIGESLGMTRTQVRERFRMKITKLAYDKLSDGGELGLIAARRALHPDNIAAGQKLGFFRPDAGLATVFVADENDICAVYPSGVTPVPDDLEKAAKKLYCKQWTEVEHPKTTIDYKAKHFSIRFPAHYSFLEDIVQRAVDAKGNMPFGFAGVIYVDPKNGPRSGEDEVGYGYKEFLEGTKGTMLDLGKENFYNDLAFLGEQVGREISLKKDFVVGTANLDPASIQVLINGTKVPHVFQASTNTVHIEEGGDFGAEIKISSCQRVSQPTPTPSPTVTPPGGGWEGDPNPDPTPTPGGNDGGGTDPDPTPTPTPEPSPTFPGGCNALDCDGTGI